MARLLNVSCKQFQRDARDKKIYLWGAGRMASQCIQAFCNQLDVIAIVDQNDNLNGTSLTVDNVAYPIINEKCFLEQIQKVKDVQERVAVFVTSTFYAIEMIKHINAISLLDDVACYAALLMRDQYEFFPVEFTNGREKIPKKIHYCWFGGKEIPDYLKKYMDSWHKFCPDYEIIRWDETNFDISKNRYVREAYECKRWGFVSDYARLDIIYNEGGIYLDTDVELIKPLDKLLCDEMFCGFSCACQIALGLGFGAVKNLGLVKQMRDYYDDLFFRMDNGQLNLKTCNEYQQPVLEEYGFLMENRYQKIGGVALYPSEVLSPDNGFGLTCYTQNTIAIHHTELSWASEEEKKSYEMQKKEISKILYLQ